MTFGNRLTAPIAAACLAAALAACSNPSPEAGRPDTAPVSSGSVTNPSPPSPSSSGPSIPSTAPTRPAAAEGLELSAAEAFYRHYVDLMNYAARTGETTELLAASEADCEGCKEYADFVEKVNEANGAISGDYSEKVKEISALSRGEGGRVGGTAVVMVGDYTTKSSPSATPVISKAKEYTETIALTPSNGSWVMFEIQLEPR